MNELLKFGKVVTGGLFCLLVAVMLTGCSKTDNDGLLDGKQPMTFTATVDGLTVTRATTGKDTWAQNDEIAVSTNADGSNHQVYQIANATTGAMSPKAEDNTLYWQQNTGQPITAWYPAATVTDADISNQSAGWADFDYLVSKGSYNFSSTGVQLSFTHAMAKVKITLQQGEGITTDEFKTAVVRVYGYTLALFDKGVASASSNQSNREIIPLVGQPQSPIPYEAIVIPQQMQNQKFIKVTIGGNDYFYTPTNNNDANLVAGNQYTYNITVKKNGLTVTASGATAWGTGSNTEVTSKELEQGYAAYDLKMGDYYYSDGTWSDGGYRKYTGGSSATLPIMPVLTSANGDARTVIGIVFWVDPNNNKKGKIVSLDEGRGKLWNQWAGNCGATSDDDGQANTNAIALFIANNSYPTFEAYQWCVDKGSGWYFPAINEVSSLYAAWNTNRDAFNTKLTTANGTAISTNLHWSSSESSYYQGSIAWGLSFGSGEVGSRGKDNLNYVRSVLAF